MAMQEFFEEIDVERTALDELGEAAPRDRFSLRESAIEGTSLEWLNSCLTDLQKYCYEMQDKDLIPSVRHFSQLYHGKTGATTFRRLVYILAEVAGISVTATGLRNFEPRLLVQPGADEIYKRWREYSGTGKKSRTARLGEAVISRGYKIYDPEDEVFLEPDELLAEIDSKKKS
jgi:hypothetical protein